MPDLDNLDIPKLDPEGSFARNRDLPDQMSEAWQAVRNLTLPEGYTGFRHVVVAGMGGSAIAGDFIQALAFRQGSVPVTVVRGYDLPAWTDADTLVVAYSHSGNTEETLSCARQAIKRGLKTIAITTGGLLPEIAGAAGAPVLQYSYDGEPRSAFGHSFMRCLALARATGVLSIPDAQIETAIAEMASLRSQLDANVPESSNQAKALARRMHNRLPVLIGGDFLSPVARRWKTQINENADAWAIWEDLPEMHHNTCVGLNLPDETAKSIHAIVLQHSALSERLQMRCKVTHELFTRNGVSHEMLDVGGPDDLSAMLRAVYLQNMSSVYLAFLYNVRPFEIDNIDWLKAQLA